MLVLIAVERKEETWQASFCPYKAVGPLRCEYFLVSESVLTNSWAKGSCTEPVTSLARFLKYIRRLANRGKVISVPLLLINSTA